jgi:tripartite-type tricarboxylate transporter receptor subunit TctC
MVICAPAAMFAAGACAQAWPAKPVRVVVPFAPGGLSDTLGRLVANKLSESLGQTFIIDIRAGAGGVTGSDLVARSAPDGYVLLVSGAGSHVVAPALSAKPLFDPMRDFTHVALLGGTPSVLAVHPSVPVQNLQELIALAKARPGALSYGSPGNGSQGQLVAEMFKRIAGINIVHVPYKGASGCAPKASSPARSTRRRSPNSSPLKSRAGRL